MISILEKLSDCKWFVKTICKFSAAHYFAKHER